MINEMRMLLLCYLFVLSLLTLTHCQNSNTVKSDASRNSNIVSFSKKMYSSLGAMASAGRPWNATALAEGLRGEYTKLSESTNGLLGSALKAIYEMRMLDLQISLTHARRLRDVLDVLEL